MKHYGKSSSIVKSYPTIDNNSRGDTRHVLRRVWNGRLRQYAPYGKNKWSGNGFRAVMNAGDPLSRINYSCGGPNMISGGVGRMTGMNANTLKDGGQSKNFCDKSNIPPQTCNVRYVYDSSDIIRYKKELAINKNYYRYKH